MFSRLFVNATYPNIYVFMAGLPFTRLFSTLSFLYCHSKWNLTIVKIHEYLNRYDWPFEERMKREKTKSRKIIRHETNSDDDDKIKCKFSMYLSFFLDKKQHWTLIYKEKKETFFLMPKTFREYSKKIDHHHHQHIFSEKKKLTKKWSLNGKSDFIYGGK